MSGGLRLVLLSVLAAVSAGAVAGEAVAAEQRVIPYLSGGAGVYVDGESGWPVAALPGEQPPPVPGIHVRPKSVPPPVAPSEPPPSVPAAPPAPPPTGDPVFTVDPALGGYYRPDFAVAAGVQVLCLTDAAWPSEYPTATGRWTGTLIQMRIYRCEGVVPSKVGTESFARGLFVLAHEAAHSRGVADECAADKAALATMGDLGVALGYPSEVGREAANYLNDLLRPNPPPDPYCIGRLP